MAGQSLAQQVQQAQQALQEPRLWQVRQAALAGTQQQAALAGTQQMMVVAVARRQRI